jgi:4'-phosphopantetheinyl transferase
MSGTKFHQESISYGQNEVHFLKYNEFNPQEHLHVLTEPELKRLLQISNLKRQQEFIATRILRNALFGKETIFYNIQGAPYIESEGYISISHSKNIVSISFSKAFEVGIDIEEISDKIIRVAPKFVSDLEQLNIDINNPVQLTKLWTGKEALYKLAKTEGLHFKEQLNLIQKSADLWDGTIQTNHETIRTELNIFEKKNFMIAFNTIACEKK